MWRHVLTRTEFLNKGIRFTLKSRNYAYLSEQFKTTMEHRFEIPHIERKITKTFSSSEDLLPFEFETFVATIVEKQEDRRDELQEKLIQLRSSSNIMPKTLNHSVINYLLAINPDDLVIILSNKLRYGIFIDAFTGCFLINALLEQKDLRAAVQVAAELVLQEESDDLVRAFSLLSAFEFVKHNANNFESLRIKPSSETSEKKDQDKQKVRVKFLRNEIENKMLNIALIDSNIIASIFTNNLKESDNRIIKDNGHLLASIINNDFASAENLLKESESVLCKDVAEIGLTILNQVGEETPTTQIIKSSLEKLKGTSTSDYFSLLNDFLKSAVNNSEGDLIEKQKKLYETWLEDRNEQLDNVLKKQAKLLREEEIRKDMDNIDNKRRELWFFQTQDQLDMEIFRKQVRYPKRWFGKKKKPRMVDDNYVPPEIRAKA